MNQTDRIEKIIRKLETELIEFAVSKDKIDSVLPINNPKQIKGLIWNLLTSEKWRSRISYKDYTDITEILFKRIQNENEKTNPERGTKDLS